MKKWLVYLCGVVTGIVLTFLFATLFTLNKTGIDDRVTWFEKEGEIVNEKSFKVFQVLEKNAALVNGQTSYTTVYLLTNDEDKYYYDNEIVNIPAGKVARQVGIYKYQTKDNFGKTVPIVKIIDK